MLLNHLDKYNSFTTKFRTELENKVISFGKNVRYKFNISNPNPHPDLKGQPVYPSRWTLDPVTFYVKDPHETREGTPKLKLVGLVKKVTSPHEKENGENDQFERIRLVEAQKGILFLDLSRDEDVQFAMYLELHPKLVGGVNADPTKRQIIERIDEKKASAEKRTQRTEKQKAVNVAQEMSDQDVLNFADAMMWDSTDDANVLRDRIEELAETSPKFFNDLTSGKSIEYQATVKRAMDKKVIAFDPAEYKFIWSDNQQAISRLQPSTEKSEVEVMAEWLMTGGDQAKKAYDKIKSLIK
jgi:hypothetical protein